MCAGWRKDLISAHFGVQLTVYVIQCPSQLRKVACVSHPWQATETPRVCAVSPLDLEPYTRDLRHGVNFAPWYLDDNTNMTLHHSGLWGLKGRSHLSMYSPGKWGWITIWRSALKKKKTKTWSWLLTLERTKSKDTHTRDSIDGQLGLPWNYNPTGTWEHNCTQHFHDCFCFSSIFLFHWQSDFGVSKASLCVYWSGTEAVGFIQKVVWNWQCLKLFWAGAKCDLRS